MWHHSLPHEKHSRTTTPTLRFTPFSLLVAPPWGGFTEVQRGNQPMARDPRLRPCPSGPQWSAGALRVASSQRPSAALPPPASSLFGLWRQAVVWNGNVWFFGGYTKKERRTPPFRTARPFGVPSFSLLLGFSWAPLASLGFLAGIAIWLKGWGSI